MSSCQLSTYAPIHIPFLLINSVAHGGRFLSSIIRKYVHLVLTPGALSSAVSSNCFSSVHGHLSSNNFAKELVGNNGQDEGW